MAAVEEAHGEFSKDNHPTRLGVNKLVFLLNFTLIPETVDEQTVTRERPLLRP